MNRIIALFAFLCAFSGYSQIVSVPTLYSTEDAQTNSGSTGTNYGTLGTMNVSVASGPAVYRGFMKFDLSTIPSNAVITSAILRLTPSGTENVTAVNSTQLYVDVCNSSWTETGISHSSNISNNTLFSTVTLSQSISGKREFIVKDFVQAMVEGRLPNNGFRVRKSDESTVLSTTYFTRENGTASNRPQLIIQYYLRSYVSAATIVHTSTLSSTDGSISPTIVNGATPTLMTYNWYNSSGTQIATTQNLTGVGKGWYGLKYWSTGIFGDTTYQAFLVGTECEDVSITFDPGPNYIDDSRFSDFVSGSGTTAINYPQANNGSNVLMLHERWTNGTWYSARDVIKFRVWVDPGCDVNSAVMTLVGNAHYPLQTPNTSELQRITSDWSEYGVAQNNMPSATATGKITVPAIPAGNGNATTDIASFFNIWKTNNTQNYGMLFQLQSYASNLYTRMQFHSSDATTPSNRPQIAFSIKVNTCDLSRKGSTTTSSNDPALKKSLQVSITPPSWAVSPYRYVISDLPIPNQTDLLTYLNDSVFDPDIDSTKLYMGTVNSTTYNFGEVDYSNYNVAVFDNNGKRIYDKKDIDLYPAITLLAASNAVVVNNNMIRPNTAANGICEVNAYVNTTSQGSVKINPTVLSGTQYYGFIDDYKPLATSGDIRFGYAIVGTKLYTIKNSVVSSSYVNITAGKNVNLTFENDTIIFSDDSTIFDKAAITAGYKLKFGGIMNSASRTYLKFKKIPLKPFFLLQTSGTERSCTTPTANFQFSINGFLSNLFGSYNYTLNAQNANSPVPSFSGTGTSAGTVTVSNVPPGVYTLTCTQTSGSLISLVYTVYIGVQADWYTTHPNYNITPNSYSLSRNNVNPISTYASAFSTNFLNAGTKGWIWFYPVVSAFLQNRNDYLSIVDNFTNTQPSPTQTYLSFRKVLPTISSSGSGTIVIIPGGIQVVWRDAITSAVGSTIIPSNTNPFITIEMTGTMMNVRANGTIIASINQPAGGIRLKANSNRTNEGFKDVHTTFACTPAQTIDQVGYYELARDYTAGYATAVEGKLKFTFDEEYGIQSGKKVQYVVYNDSNNPIASGDMSGTVTGGASALAYSFDDNRYTLTVSSISTATVGKFYHLEVTTSTGQKRVLRFLYKN
ncbi:DNRLRE domain-containing protein [Fluviicola sp.]|uniref:DNRLRE domain-containing protein n=1 Tax=Fluviicola sp. TaxID=1917219 RepID=UPI0031D52EDB